jgi:hypothetical protein
MAQVWLDDRLCKRGDLPDVCMKCGAPTPDRVKKQFAYMPPWSYVVLLFGVLGIIIFLVLVATLRKSVNAQVPLCREHRNHWLSRTLLVVFSLIGGIGLIVLVVVAMNSLQGGGVRDVLPLLIIAIIVSWLILAIVVSVTSIRCVEINDRQGVKLQGVCQEFVDAYRDEYDYDRPSRLDRDALDRWDEPRPSRPARDERSDDRRYRREDEEDDRRRERRDRYSDDY